MIKIIFMKQIRHVERNTVSWYYSSPHVDPLNFQRIPKP